MTYEVVLEKSGQTTSVVVEDVKSESEAKSKALKQSENGYHVSRTKLIME